VGEIGDLMVAGASAPAFVLAASSRLGLVDVPVAGGEGYAFGCAFDRGALAEHQVCGALEGGEVDDAFGDGAFGAAGGAGEAEGAGVGYRAGAGGDGGVDCAEGYFAQAGPGQVVRVQGDAERSALACEATCCLRHQAGAPLFADSAWAVRECGCC
jgi:hypothetical protein